MRLLNARSLVLESFEGNAIPPYHILSHTWGTDEVSFQDIQRQGTAFKQKAGCAKIKYACDEALELGLEWVWVDTCCIDKSSSAELSEAINSMFQWYQNATGCYAYLVDVSDISDIHASDSDFARSRWFTRGWTLQELLAPKAKSLHFFSANGKSLGTVFSLRKQISEITGIEERFLIGEARFTQASISKRMSWASGRTTFRIEDLAYCLLGIFGISMPLLYGEGAKAFRRLQEEIMKNSTDQTLFAWGSKTILGDFRYPRGPFADEPNAFKDSGDFVPDELNESSIPYAMTNMGLQITLPIIELPHRKSHFAVLACRPEGKFQCVVAIPIRFHNVDSFTRRGPSIVIVRRDELLEATTQSLRFIANLEEELPILMQRPGQRSFIIRKVPKRDSGLRIWKVEPSEAWDPEQRALKVYEYGLLYTVIRLWRHEGEGYAIVISLSDSQPYTWRHRVIKETSSHRLTYKSLSPRDINNSGVWEYFNRAGEVSGDIKVIVGQQDIRMSNGLVIHQIRTLDIEVASDRT